MILDGKKVADEICADLKARCDALKKQNVHPDLTIITSGDDSASKIYVRNKVKRCDEIGIKPVVKHFDHLEWEDVAGNYGPLIVQEPITGSVLHEQVANWMPSWMDMDGLSLRNMSRLAVGLIPEYQPCTPEGIMRLLAHYDIPIEGKKALVIGRSNIVGRPMAMLLEQANATVTVAHSKTPKARLLDEFVDADIIVSAVGQTNVISERDFWDTPIFDGTLKEKVIVDVGMNRDENGKLCGDIPESFKSQCGWYTPTPGGTGPMTIAMLMEHTIQFYERTFSLWTKNRND